MYLQYPNGYAATLFLFVIYHSQIFQFHPNVNRFCFLKITVQHRHGMIIRAFGLVFYLNCSQLHILSTKYKFKRNKCDKLCSWEDSWTGMIKCSNDWKRWYKYNYMYRITQSPSHSLRVRAYIYLKQIVLLQEGPPWQNTNWQLYRD
jgi:hypothetical protein